MLEQGNCFGITSSQREENTLPDYDLARRPGTHDARADWNFFSQSAGVQRIGEEQPQLSPRSEKPETKSGERVPVAGKRRIGCEGATCGVSLSDSRQSVMPSSDSAWMMTMGFSR